MGLKTTFSFCLLAVLAVNTPAWAQEGHPLKGSWLGTWGPAPNHQNQVLLVLDWSGSALTGTINPGTDNIPIQDAEFLSESWSVRFEAETMDRSGNTLRYVIEGTIENPILHDRIIIGKWTHSRGSGEFRVIRQ